MDNLGFLSLKWVVEASIVGNENVNATLVNNSTVFEGPWANFFQMAILTSGVYTLRFQIINPPEASQFSVLSNPVTVNIHTLKLWTILFFFALLKRKT